MNTTWMDGIPYVTQFPIMPRQTFSYHFRATPSGTHWYHSHFQDQRIDGLVGMLIVHETLPQISEFDVSVSDWFHVDGRTLAAASPFHLNNPGTGEFDMMPIASLDPDNIRNMIEENGHMDNSRHAHGESDLDIIEDNAGNMTSTEVDVLNGLDSHTLEPHNQSMEQMQGMTTVAGIIYVNKPNTDDLETNHMNPDHSDYPDNARHDMYNNHGMNSADFNKKENMHGFATNTSSVDHNGHQSTGSPYGQRYNDMNIISILINGRGRFGDNHVPLTIFEVYSGNKYRFRVVNTGANLPIEISIDQHKIVVIATDGGAIWPIVSDTIMIFAGETMDFELTANQMSGIYWVRVKGKHGSHSINEKAILWYKMENGHFNEPISEPKQCAMHDKCIYFNCPPATFPAGLNKTCISMSQSRSLYISTSDKYWVSKDPADTNEIFVNMGMTGSPHFNGIRHIPPQLPLSIQSNDSIIKCDNIACKNSCSCTHIMSLRYNQTIDLVLTNYDLLDQHTIIGHHPVHLHGHNFAVIKQGFPTIDSTSGYLIPNRDIICDSDVCNAPKWRHNRPHDYNIQDPPIKNTVIVPSLGYVVVRFQTDNPGHWLLNCQIGSHSTTGMVIIFEEAVERIPTPPKQMTSHIYQVLPHDVISQDQTHSGLFYTLSIDGEFNPLIIW